MATLIENVNALKAVFTDIKNAIINKGVSVPTGTPVTEYAGLITSIQSGSSSAVLPEMQDKTITENGVYTSDYPYYGLGKVTVDVKYTIDGQSDYSHMFRENHRIDLLTSGKIDTSHATNLSHMAYNSTNLTQVMNIDFSSAENAERMFYGCNKLTYINNSNILEFPKVISADSMFYNCSSLTSINRINMRNVSSGTNMFYQGFNGADLTLELSSVFNGSETFERAKIKNLTIASDTVINNANKMFEYSGIVSIKGLNLSGVTSASGYSGMFSNCNTVENLELVGEIKNYNISFSGLTRLTHESLINILNALCENGTATCSLGSTNLAKLTDEEKAIATNKGWTLS